MIVKWIGSGFIALALIIVPRQLMLHNGHSHEADHSMEIMDVKEVTSNETEMKVVFKNVQNEKIKSSFLEVVSRYEILHPYEIILEQKRIKKSTMQAQPILGLKGIFNGAKKYKVKLALLVSDSEEMVVADLPAEVLTGWFAHELGHIVDYEQYSNMGMVRYGLRYLTSRKFKRQAEHDADLIAIDHGFHAEIIAAKRFILDHELLGEGYKDRIRKYYMSIEDVEMCLEENKVPLEPKL